MYTRSRSHRLLAAGEIDILSSLNQVFCLSSLLFVVFVYFILVRVKSRYTHGGAKRLRYFPVIAHHVCPRSVQLHATRNKYWPLITDQGPVSLRVMTSQFKYIVTHTQKYKTVKWIFYGVLVQNFVCNFKGPLRNFTENLEPILRKICILRGGKNLTSYDILDLWHLKS